MTNPLTNPLTIDASDPTEVAPGVWIVSDHFIPLVPNAAIIEGTDAVLVFETGMGPASGTAMLEKAIEIAAGRQLYLTLSHFHPEHAFGAQVFKGIATILYNESQRLELADKGAGYLELFATFGPDVADALDGVVLVEPDRTYSDRTQIDLGGRVVELIEIGQAHTRGDQLVWLPEERIVFAGDLLETNVFPIFPFFPPDDTDVDGNLWIDALHVIRDLDPTVIVPGHGHLGGTELVDIAEDYLRELGSRAIALRDGGLGDDEVVAQLAPAVEQKHAGWREPNWVESGIRSFLATGFSR